MQIREPPKSRQYSQRSIICSNSTNSTVSPTARSTEHSRLLSQSRHWNSRWHFVVAERTDSGSFTDSLPKHRTRRSNRQTPLPHLPSLMVCSRCQCRQYARICFPAPDDTRADTSAIRESVAMNWRRQGNDLVIRDAARRFGALDDAPLPSWTPPQHGLLRNIMPETKWDCKHVRLRMGSVW